MTLLRSVLFLLVVDAPAAPDSSEQPKLELAARLRDEVNELKKEMRGMDAAGVREQPPGPG